MMSRRWRDTIISNLELANLYKYFHENYLSFNLSKTNHIAFRTDKNQYLI